ncbi:ras-related protein Rab-28-like isoform X2 [Homalodisca vitripennis]|uniref:ras-related protein Rab-28-like isoform X2 n=1 Tax=Homalodisca vitripennis TaxID=197043 RepID=UPI001EEB5F0C|nr:ras-related protein Rab-28-like isoform X2 [Homalodisca vitripennis]
MEDDLPEKCVKLVLLGDSSVGKGNRLVRAVVWDVGGESLDTTMFQNYLYGTQAILLIFDITNLTSFNHLMEWLNAASSFVFGKPPLVTLIANKCDMEHQRAVSLEKQMRFVNELGIHSTHSVSARTGENVTLAFQRILAELLGLRLSRVDQEEQLSVVKAEILAANHNQAYAGLQTPPSTICSLQ